LAEDDISIPLHEHFALPLARCRPIPAAQPGSFIGPYRVESLLGVGGMGEVYRARDTKLNRDVAIKILPPAFANDPERLARFKREAQVLASLNHPNIGSIYGFEDQDGVHALVLELVEGPTLADRLARGPLPIDEALALARQIADALEAAHEQGLIHRDLKPSNIKVRDDGTVKVLDFGLAKIIGAGTAGEVDKAGRPDKAAEDLTRSPTITTPVMTAAGMILGTAAYMSPEQAKGKPCDKRSDIWAFGCVLYEMLTGERPSKATMWRHLAAILRSEPDWQALGSSTPPLVRRLLLRCLAKERKNRIPDAAALRLDLGEASTSRGDETPSPRSRRPAHLAIAAVLGAVAAGAVAIVVAGRTPPPVTRMQFDIATPQSREPASFAVSPNGEYIAYVADAEEQSQLWVRDLEIRRAHVLRAMGPRFCRSPNSRSIGFVAGRLKRVDLAGAPSRSRRCARRPVGST
jgi:serine/threonine-protein kinase